MSDDNLEDDLLPPRSSRRGMIEFLQVLSLLLLAGVFLDIPTELRIALPCAAAVLAVIPFFLIRLPEWESVDSPRGFKITLERLRILEEIDIPEDIVFAIRNSMIDVYYPKRKDLRAALLRVLGEARVQPWLNDILRHAKYYGDPPALGAVGTTPLPGDPPEKPPTAPQPETGTAEDSHDKTAEPRGLGELKLNLTSGQQT